ISFAPAGSGTLSNPGGGSLGANGASYTVSGSPAAVSAALQGLVFTPTPHLAAPGQTLTTSFTITASDSIAGTSATDSISSVAATAVAVPPAVLNNSDGTSYRYLYYPSSTARWAVTRFSAAGASGSAIAD